MSSTELSGLIRPALMSILEAGGVPGATVSVRIGGREAASLGLGYEDLEARYPMPASATMLIYSASKTLLASACLRRVEEGALALDQSAHELSPFRKLNERITVCMLLNHTSGLPDYGALPEYHEAVRQHPGLPWSHDEFMERTMVQGLLFEPGQGWAYSNIGYMLMRHILERAYGEPVAAVMSTLLTRIDDSKPLRPMVSVEDLHHLAPGYASKPDGTTPTDVRGQYHPGWVAHGVSGASASDLTFFLDALLTGRIVGQSALNTMLDAVPVDTTHPLFAMPGYGLGLMIDRADVVRGTVGHGGGGPGYSAGVYSRVIDDLGRVTVAVLANGDAYDAATVMVHRVFELLGDRDLRRSLQRIA